MDKQRQPWLNSAISDSIFILSPPFFSLLLIFVFPGQFQKAEGIPVVHWLFLIVFIDVAHVYSTLYRTYFNTRNLKKEYVLLTAIPILCYTTGVLIYSYDGLLFWRLLAYLAVYHFIRQQYGFMRLYSRSERLPKYFKTIDLISIYTATIYPLIFWHLKGSRNFNWFVEGDFLSFKNDRLLQISTYIYFASITIYLVKEIVLIIKERQFNIPRNLLVFGTFLSWYFGIVYFNGDLAFTTINVISHGIPYMALIWFFEKKKNNVATGKNKILQLSFGKYGLFYFLIILIAFAYFEEGLWDGFIWKEHQTVFSIFAGLPQINNQYLLAFIIPLLALPQSTHYVLDGFIWRKNRHF